VPLIADNTATPLIARPFEHGAAVVVYSATKYIGGHGTSIGGLIVDGGNFPWEEHAERFPLLSAAGRGLSRRDLDRSREAARADRLRLARARQAAARPRRGALAVQRVPAHSGLETLPLQAAPAQRERDRGREFPQQRADVSHVIFPGLQTGEPRRRADAYLKGGYGGLVGFELKGGVEAGRKFIDSLKLLYHVANIGDARSLAIHPASTTHQQLTPRSSSRPASRPATCGFQSESNIPTTFSKIWRRRSTRQAARRSTSRRERPREANHPTQTQRSYP
jgi:O-acetylhomoserine (thiol)-lyase